VSSVRLDFASLFREHYPRVYRYVRFRVDSDAVAEDLTAEIFERAYRYRDGYDPARASFSTWVGQIAHNWINNYMLTRERKDRAETDLTDAIEQLPHGELSPESQIIQQETFARLLHCIKLLAERERQIVALRFGADLRNKDIADLLGLKQNSVSVFLLRALERLRGCQGEA
jgi:RNA polymerase sigma factor (sigma-70 family)